MAAILATSITRRVMTQRISIGRFVNVSAKTPSNAIKKDHFCDVHTTLASSSDAKLPDALIDLQKKYESYKFTTTNDADTTKLIGIPKLLKLILQLIDLAVQHMNEKPKERFHTNRSEYLVDVPGYEKDDLKVEIQGRTLYITGVGEDFLEQDISIKKEVKIPDNCIIDPEEGRFDTRNGQLKATFPISEDQTLLEKTGRYVLK